MIEFALASILIFTILFGIVQFGRAVWQYNTMSNLAQEGARWASVRGSSSSISANSTQLQTFVESRATGIPVTVTAIPANPSAAAPGSTIEVRVSSTFSPVVGLLPNATLTLESTARMIVSR